jgi:UDP-glucose-4-epimerase GalE
VSARVVVVGGAGYIGSHMVKRLAGAGHHPVTLDNLSTGHRDAVTHGDFIHVDLLDKDRLSQALTDVAPDVVMHFAAFAYVGESVTNPRRYFTNNVVGTLNLLHSMLDAGVSRLVFSSTCATYGVPERSPIPEDARQEPINPYGRTKLMVEQVLREYVAHGLRSIALRYFNAAGADSEGELRERHHPETHLIPLVLQEAARVGAGGSPEDTTLTLFGDDYPTPDGTCVRDYIHVEDIASAHQLALERLLQAPQGFEAFNLGTETGASVLQVIEAARRVTGADIRYKIVARRPGDPPELVGSFERARAVLGWTPNRSSLETILETAWRSWPKQG